MFHLPLPVRDANAGSGTDSSGEFAGMGSERSLHRRRRARTETRSGLAGEGLRSFAADYEGKLADLDADGLLECILRNEKISSIAGRIMSFAGLRYYQLTTDGGRAKFMSDCQEKITNFTTPLVFFTLELNRLDDDALTGMFAQNADLARYKPVFDRIRAMKPYQLSDELEKFLHDLGVVGDAWERLFDETIAGLKFDVDGEELSIEGTLNLLTDPDRAKREAAAR